MDNPLEASTEYDYLFNLLVIGDTCAGKTELISRFVEDYFSEGRLTIGWDCQVKTVRIEGKLVKLRIWDTAGQERFRTITSCYCRRADGILIIYDVCDKRSFLEVTAWLEEAQRYSSPDLVKVLVGNKCDRPYRVVSYESARDFAKSHQMTYFETSAKERTSVDEAFTTVAREMLQTRQIKGAKQASLYSNTSGTTLGEAVALNQERQETLSLFEEAMQSGYVLCNLVILLLIGVAGSGKTSFSQLVLNKPPPAVRESTPLAQAAIRVVSISKAAVCDSEEGTVWRTVSPVELLHMLGDGIRSKIMIHFATPMPVSPNTNPIRRILHRIRKPKQDIPNQPGDLLTTEHKPSISKLAKSKPVEQVLSHMAASATPEEVFSDHWVYMIDTGGQPQYHELIPTFVHHVSGAAFFVKLNEELDSHPMIAYYAEGGKLCGSTYSSPLTHRQTITNCLQMIQSRLNISGEKECPSLFFVGTHRDLESSCPETGDDKDKQLREMLKSLKDLNKHLVFYRVARPEELMFRVNGKNPKPIDYEMAGEFRKAVMSGCRKIQLKIPLSWFILEQQLQELAQRLSELVLSFEECLQVAADLEMDKARLLAAVDYFVRLNLFKFFPQILPNVVFTTSQVLLDKISELVAYSHLLRGEPSYQQESLQVVYDVNSLRFRDHGIVNMSLLQQFKTHYRYSDSLFTPQELLDVLSNQLVFAPFVGEDYFMPCVLPQLPPEELSSYRLDSESTSAAPMLIYYHGGLFSTGLFSALVAFLQDRSSWKVAERHGEPVCLYKNCIMFKHSDFPITLTLIYSFDFVEIHLHIQRGFVPEPYTSVRTTLFLGLNRAAKIQGCDGLCPEIGFPCPCGEGSTHLATVSNDWRWWSCSLDDTCSDALSEEHLIWLTDYTDTPATTVTHAEKKPVSVHVPRSDRPITPIIPTLQDKPTLHHLLVLKGRGDKRVRVLDSVAADWEELAIALGLEARDIDCIKRDNIQNAKGACREVFAKWLNGEGNLELPITWDTLVHSLIDAGQVGIAEDLREILS